MHRPTLAFAAIFTPTGLLGLTTLFAGATAVLLSGGASPEAAGLFALAFLLGTAEAFLVALGGGLRHLLGARARRAAVAHAQANAATETEPTSHG